MNSEELEKSLRTEFESYLKNTLADMRQEVFQLQYKIDSEVEKYKAQIDEVFKEFSEKAREDHQLGEDFQESIVEHLRLARDDGATITAQAIAEAEKLGEDKTSPASLDVTDLRDAINDISSQTSQATILKSLIDHAEKFVPRGAFFVVKNQNFVGWRVFGNENPSGDDDIREIYFETSRPTVLSESVDSLRTVESAYGSFEEDSVFLSPLGFGEPDRMFAVPLVARGRGVAAVYADAGEGGNDLNIAALETLVRLAGLTVELLAAAAHTGAPRAATPAPAPSRSFAETPAETVEEETEAVAEEAESYEPAEETAEETYEAAEAEETVETENFEEAEPEYEAAEEEEGAEEVYETSDEDEAEAEVAESFEESYETAPAVDYEDYSETVETFDEAETEELYETVEAEAGEETEVAVAEADEETEAAEEVSAEEAEFETVEAEDETYEISDEVETATDYETSSEYEPEAVQMPSEPFDPSESQEFDTSEYLSDETHAEALTDDFVADDDSIEEVQASEDEVGETVDFAEDSQTEEESLGEEAAEDLEVEEDPIPVAASEPQEQETFAEAEEETAPPVRSRLARRNVDLPIEVSEDERKLHNDARRFARLLVSEIKLYNEQKVAEGRSSGDLYERLQEAIDRSREMYDKRVQPPVAERFDYFHYEVVNTLGEGEEAKLGSKYPGATV